MEEPKLKQLKLYRAFDGENAVGWDRDDVPMVHVLGKARPGAKFQPSDGHGGPHWPCPICDAHGYNETHFRNQMLWLMKAPEKP